MGPSEAARSPGVSAGRVRQLVAAGKLAAVVTPLGRRLRVTDVEALAQWRAGLGGGRPEGGAHGRRGPAGAGRRHGPPERAAAGPAAAGASRAAWLLPRTPVESQAPAAAVAPGGVR